MIQMKISFHATIREVAGVSETDVKADDIPSLLLALRDKFGERLYRLIAKDGRLRDDVVVLVNGQNIEQFGGIEAKLTPNDEVAIFPPVSGG
jgi:molybdopterin synthase sulfur carrier subunit